LRAWHSWRVAPSWSLLLRGSNLASLTFCVRAWAMVAVRGAGYRAMKAGLTADTFLEATSVHRIKERYQDYEFSEELEQRIITESQVPGTYAKLARSIAPEIWGHEGLC